MEGESSRSISKKAAIGIRRRAANGPSNWNVHKMVAGSTVPAGKTSVDIRRFSRSDKLESLRRVSVIRPKDGSRDVDFVTCSTCGTTTAVMFGNSRRRRQADATKYVLIP